MLTAVLSARALRGRSPRAGARMFGGNGGVTPVAGSSTWGFDLTGKVVTTSAGYLTAQAQLRSSAGHDPTKATTFPNPVNWASVRFEPRPRVYGVNSTGARTRMCTTSFSGRRTRPDAAAPAHAV